MTKLEQAKAWAAANADKYGGGRRATAPAAPAAPAAPSARKKYNPTTGEFE